MVNSDVIYVSIPHFCGCIGIRVEVSIRESLPTGWPPRRNLPVPELFPYLEDLIESHLVASIRPLCEQASFRRLRCFRSPQYNRHCSCQYYSSLTNTENTDPHIGIRLSIGYRRRHSEGHRHSYSVKICFHIESRMNKLEALLRSMKIFHPEAPDSKSSRGVPECFLRASNHTPRATKTSLVGSSRFHYRYRFHSAFFRMIIFSQPKFSGIV
mmetsp:Transcript_19571/g.42555  ORF Transcript_19571/g.42555 Transcript_19571/m.42555 type:complete len:212 (-) Transcript_19571:771-1406(-)